MPHRVNQHVDAVAVDLFGSLRVQQSPYLVSALLVYQPLTY